MKIRIDYTLDLSSNQIEALKDAYELDKNGWGDKTGWGQGIYEEGDTFRQWIKSMAQFCPKSLNDLMFK